MAKETGSRSARFELAVEDPELIPARRYWDAGFFELERENLWSRAWQMACRLEEIPEVGDFTEYRLLEKSVLVVRTKEGIKAFHNACRHRGMKLASGSGNCGSRGFVCPFHGWAYAADGTNTLVPGRHAFSEDVLDPAALNLKPCRVDTWGGCVFISFDDDALPLRETLGPVADKLDARLVDRLRTEWWLGSELPVNWKVAVEAFIEMYHLMKTHPEFHRHARVFGGEFGDRRGIDPKWGLDARQAVAKSIDVYANLSEGMGGLIHASEVDVMERLRDIPLPEDPEEAVAFFMNRACNEIQRAGEERGTPTFDIASVLAGYPSQGNELIFPNLFFLPGFSAMESYRIRPTGPETCLFEIWSLVLVPEDEPWDSPRAPRMLPHDSPEYPLIPHQDFTNMPEQQLGLRSGGVACQRLSREYEGAVSSFERLIDGYIEGRDRAQLARASHVVNGCSFHPIEDIGF